MKAYLKTALQLNGVHYDASTDDRPSIVDLDESEFKRLEDMLAVRAPTETEVALFKVLNPVVDIEEAEVVSETKPAGRKAKVGKPEGEQKPEGERKPEGEQKPEGAGDEEI